MYNYNGKIHNLHNNTYIDNLDMDSSFNCFSSDKTYKVKRPPLWQNFHAKNDEWKGNEVKGSLGRKCFYVQCDKQFRSRKKYFTNFYKHCKKGTRHIFTNTVKKEKRTLQIFTNTVKILQPRIITPQFEVDFW